MVQNGLVGFAYLQSLSPPSFFPLQPSFLAHIHKHYKNEICVAVTQLCGLQLHFIYLTLRLCAFCCYFLLLFSLSRGNSTQKLNSSSSVSPFEEVIPSCSRERKRSAQASIAVLPSPRLGFNFSDLHLQHWELHTI